MDVDAAAVSALAAGFAQANLRGDVSGSTLLGYLTKHDDAAVSNYTAHVGHNNIIAWLKTAGANSTRYALIDSELEAATLNQGATLQRGTYIAKAGTVIHEFFTFLDREKKKD